MRQKGIIINAIEHNHLFIADATQDTVSRPAKQYAEQLALTEGALIDPAAANTVRVCAEHAVDPSFPVGPGQPCGPATINWVTDATLVAASGGASPAFHRFIGS